MYGQKGGLLWRCTTPLVHSIICGINASGGSRLRTAALFFAAPSVIMANKTYLLSSKLEIREQAFH